MRLLLLVLTLSFQEGIEALIHRLGSDSVDVRTSAVAAILARWNELKDQDLAQLDKAAKSGDPEVARLAADAVARIRIRRAVGEKILARVKDIDRLLSSRDERERLRAFEQVVNALRMKEIRMEHLRGLGPLVVPLVRSPIRDVQSEGFQLLVTFDLRDAIPDLVSLLKDTRAETRASAAWSLGKMGATEHAGTVVPLLGDRAVVWSAIRALGMLGRKEDAARLAPFLKDSESRVREGALESLGDLEAREYTGQVLRFLDDPDDHVRSTALWTLGKLGAREHASKVAPFLKIQEGTARHSALSSLYFMGAHEQLNEVLPLFKEEHLDFIQPAGRMTAAFGTADHANRLLEILKDLPAAGAIFALYSLGEIGSPEHAGKLVPLLKTDKEEILPSVFESLGRLAGRDELGVLQELLAKDQAWIRAYAAFALGHAGARVLMTPDRADLARRLEVLEQDPEESVRLAASVALTRLGKKDRAGQRELLGKLATRIFHAGWELIEALNELHEGETLRSFERVIEVKKTVDSIPDFEEFFRSAGLELKGEKLRRWGRLPSGTRTSPRRAYFYVLDPACQKPWVMDDSKVRLMEYEDAVAWWLRRLADK